MKEKKTNVMRLLEAQKIDYIVREYEPDPHMTGLEIANLLGLDADAVFKTLVTFSEKAHEHFVFVIPVGAELDLKKAAKAAGVKDIEMIKQKELLPLTGYVHGGCSPIGMKRVFRTYVDETAQLFERIAFSGGKVGMQVETSFDDFSRAVEFELHDLVKD